MVVSSCSAAALHHKQLKKEPTWSLLPKEEGGGGGRYLYCVSWKFCGDGKAISDVWWGKLSSPPPPAHAVEGRNTAAALSYTGAIYIWLKGQCHEIFDFMFFYESASPTPLSKPLGRFRKKNSRRYSQLKVHHRGRWHRWQMKKSSIRSFNYFFGIPLWSRIIQRNFSLKFTVRCHQSDIVPIICRRCRWYRWCTFTCAYLREYSKKCKMTLMLFSGAWGKMIHERTWRKKTLVTLSLARCSMVLLQQMVQLN